MKHLKQIGSWFIALSLLFSLASPALAAESAVATSLRIEETEGEVTVKDATGNVKALRSGMRLYSGYAVETAAGSSAYISMDETKAVKLDALTRVEIKKSGKQLEAALSAGQLFFNVTAPLKTDESLNIRTSTMVTGVRGSFGWVNLLQMGMLHGRANVTTFNQSTGETRTSVVTSGTMITYEAAAASDGTQAGAFVEQEIQAKDVPAVAAAEVASHPELQQQLAEDVPSINVQEILDTLPEKQAEQARQEQELVEQAEQAKTAQDTAISELTSENPGTGAARDNADQVFESASAPAGTGSSGGSSSGGPSYRTTSSESSGGGSGGSGSGSTPVVPQTATGDTVFALLDTNSDRLISGNGTLYYELTAFVNGEKSMVRLSEALVADLLQDSAAYAGGEYALLDSIQWSSEDSITYGRRVQPVTGSVAEANGTIGLGGTIYTCSSQVKVFFVGPDGILASGIKAIPTSGTTVIWFALDTSGQVSCIYWEDTQAQTDYIIFDAAQPDTLPDYSALQDAVQQYSLVDIINAGSSYGYQLPVSSATLTIPQGHLLNVWEGDSPRTLSAAGAADSASSEQAYPGALTIPQSGNTTALEISGILSAGNVTVNGLVTVASEGSLNAESISISDTGHITTEGSLYTSSDAAVNYIRGSSLYITGGTCSFSGGVIVTGSLRLSGGAALTFLQNVTIQSTATVQFEDGGVQAADFKLESGAVLVIISAAFEAARMTMDNGTVFRVLGNAAVRMGRLIYSGEGEGSTPVIESAAQLDLPDPEQLDTSSEQALAVVIGQGIAGSVNNTPMVNLLLTDGTVTSEVELSTDGGAHSYDAATGVSYYGSSTSDSVTAGDIVSYSKAGDKYALTLLRHRVNFAVTQSMVANQEKLITRGSASLNEAAFGTGSSAQANDSTAFLLKDTEGSYKPYTGSSAVPTVVMKLTGIMAVNSYAGSASAAQLVYMDLSDGLAAIQEGEEETGERTGTATVEKIGVGGTYGDSPVVQLYLDDEGAVVNAPLNTANHFVSDSTYVFYPDERTRIEEGDTVTYTVDSDGLYTLTLTKKAASEEPEPEEPEEPEEPAEPAALTASWDDSTPGVLTWEAVNGAAGYKVTVGSGSSSVSTYVSETKADIAILLMAEYEAAATLPVKVEATDSSESPFGTVLASCESLSVDLSFAQDALKYDAHISTTANDEIWVSIPAGAAVAASDSTVLLYVLDANGTKSPGRAVYRSSATAGNGYTIGLTPSANDGLDLRAIQSTSITTDSSDASVWKVQLTATSGTIYNAASGKFTASGANEVTVTFKAEGGTFSDGKTDKTITVAEGSTISSSDVSAPAWGTLIFAGWHDKDGNAWDSSAAVQSSLVFYAGWTLPLTFAEPGRISWPVVEGADSYSVGIIRGTEPAGSMDVYTTADDSTVTCEVWKFLIASDDFSEGALTLKISAESTDTKTVLASAECTLDATLDSKTDSFPDFRVEAQSSDLTVVLSKGIPSTYTDGYILYQYTDSSGKNAYGSLPASDVSLLKPGGTEATFTISDAADTGTVKVRYIYITWSSSSGNEMKVDCSSSNSVSYPG